jgi:hypothetical protein
MNGNSVDKNDNECSSCESIMTNSCEYFDEYYDEK